MFLLYGTRDLHLDSKTLGGILATASVGGLIGAAISGRVIGRFRLGRVYLVAQSALLLGPTLIVTAAGPRPVMIGMFVLSFFITYLGLGVGVIIVSVSRTLWLPVVSRLFGRGGVAGCGHRCGVRTSG
ncbi:hypothetical protein OH809_36770 [Streptomyces sp. NBC_00873]|uniref:hypothetical protein n=1 Tax=unclassified Streptomyces TaxID=2593676 RepID=UPI0038708B92|nr:hypothetical protein OH809_36770 [Streptomyces sp. NBC_00873]WTA42379.1 hypothetical protein OH821_06940 [Streptomyces sp. NBC_00842]